MTIVDLEGHELARYDELTATGKTEYGRLGDAFVCYTENPQCFTFLTTGDQDRIEIQSVEGH